jgi:putative flippase GtrA
MRILFRQFAGYLLTGGAAAVVDAGGFALLLQAGIAMLPAATASFLVAAVVNFQLSARFVFRQKPTGRGFLLFLAGALIGWAVNVAVTVTVARLFGVPPVLAKIVGIGLAFSINFLLNRLVVFRVRALR